MLVVLDVIEGPKTPCLDNKTSTEKGNTTDNTMIKEVLHTRIISHVHALWSITILYYKMDYPDNHVEIPKESPRLLFVLTLYVNFTLEEFVRIKYVLILFSVNHPMLFLP